MHVACRCSLFREVHGAFDIVERRLGPAHGNVGLLHGDGSFYLCSGGFHERNVEVQIQMSLTFCLGACERARDKLRDGACLHVVEELLKFGVGVAVDD